tara:strand:- start:1767 stop:2522 length:756 start_codon:yes stop_codon:yes gene_type:complete
MTTKNNYTSEAGHWYDIDGTPMYTIIGANGKERNTTLRDARSLGLVPSVTTIIGMSAKPSLENWKITEALKASLKVDKDDPNYINKCKSAGKEVGLEAAKQGTKIHAQIEQGFLGEKETKPYKVIKSWLDETYPDEEWIAEDSFCATQGYGGKIDLYSKSGIFIDFKTKDNLEDKEASNLVYDDHGMQLSAYAQGCNVKSPERISIFVDRADTGLVLPHIWEKKSHAKHKKMFNSLLTYWKLVKNYDSAVI